MGKKLTEMYPLQDQYGGGGRGGGTTPRRGRISSPRPVEKISTNQKLDSTDSIEVFQATTTKGKAAIASPKVMNLTNNGQAAIGITLQIPIWTNDTTQSGSNYLQLILQIMK